MDKISDRDILDMRKYGESVSGPIVYAFVEWILYEARRKGIRRLWFLARDGYLPYLIATKMCAHFRLDIDCRYLYCSRRSLRTASYHIVSDEELSSQLFVYGYHVTVSSLLARLELDKDVENAIISGLDIPLDKPLSRDEFSRLCSKLSQDKGLFFMLRARSLERYRSAVAYFEDVGLLDENDVCIVDSGWTGSMQRSFRILLDSLGYRGKICGFYFGMYRTPLPCDGEYFTYCFSAREGLFRRAFFNNNLFECMLSAPHPMTEKYAFINDVSRPCFRDVRDYNMHLMVLSQIDGALSCAENKILENTTKTLAENKKRKIFRSVIRASIMPARREAELFSRFLFSDDVTEKYMHSLADKNMRDLLRSYAVLPRLLRRIRRTSHGREELLWPYGTAAFLPPYLRAWYGINLLLWDLARAVRQSIFGGE